MVFTTFTDPAFASGSEVTGTDVLPADCESGFLLDGEQKALGTLQCVETDDSRIGRAMRLCTRLGSTQEWNVLAMADTAAPIHGGDVVLARFWMRCVESMTGEGSLGIVVELNHGTNEKAVEARFSIGGDWTECFVPFQATRDFAAGEARISLRIGFDRQTIEVGKLRVVNYREHYALSDLPRTRLTYLGREREAAWRVAAAERIEQYRKADLFVEAVDENDEPIAGAKVDVRLRRHAFGFGTCVTATLLNDPSEDGRRYRQVLTSLFNRVTFENDMKWPAVYDGVPPQTDRAVAWLQEHQFEIRGHNLVWPSWRWMPCPMKAFRDDPSEIRRRVNAHIASTSAHFRGKLIHWDVVNEPYSEHDLIDVLGRDAMVHWFKLARAGDPEAKLFLNDYGIFDLGVGKNDHADHFYETIRFLKDSGAPIDGIGIQGHFAADLPSAEALLATLDRFSEFGLPIESTEITVSIEDQQLQTDYLRDYLTVLFSHPNVTGIGMWGFWIKSLWRPLSAFYGEDWELRPLGRMFLDLVRKVWSTRESLLTNALGLANVRGFLGNYEVTVHTPDGQMYVDRTRLVAGGTRLKVRCPRRVIVETAAKLRETEDSGENVVLK